MNRLPVNPAADKKFMEYCRKYYRTLLTKADLYARARDGNSIETGDFNCAYEDIENQGRRSQLLLAAGSAAIGAGLSGVIQNTLDGKSHVYLIAFAVVLVFGAWSTYLALSRK